MSNWSETFKANLLTHSQDQSDLMVALSEWAHTGVVTDYGYAIESCQLCDHPQLRYHFKIVNRHTQASLQVGSSCIERFNITVYDGAGHELQGAARSKQLQVEIAAIQQEMALEPLRQLWEQREDSQEEIEHFVLDYQRRGGFSPRQLLSLCKQMTDQGIQYLPHLFKVVLRSNADKDSLYSMAAADKALIWDSLSSSQKGRYAKGLSAYEARRKRKMEKLRLAANALRPAKTTATAFHPPATKQTQPQMVTLPEQPIRYVASAHRYKITLFDSDGLPAARVFRGNLEDAFLFIQQRVGDSPNYEKGEIRLTRTNEFVAYYPPIQHDQCQGFCLQST